MSSRSLKARREPNQFGPLFQNRQLNQRRATVLALTDKRQTRRETGTQSLESLATRDRSATEVRIHALSIPFPQTLIQAVFNYSNYYALDTDSRQRNQSRDHHRTREWGFSGGAEHSAV